MLILDSQVVTQRTGIDHSGDVADIIRTMSAGRSRAGRVVSMTERLDMTEADLAAIRHDPVTNNVIVPIGPGAQKGYGEAVRRYWRERTSDIEINNIVFRYR
jgi:hypothetical protein